MYADHAREPIEHSYWRCDVRNSGRLAATRERRSGAEHGCLPRSVVSGRRISHVRVLCLVRLLHAFIIKRDPVLHTTYFIISFIRVQ